MIEFMEVQIIQNLFNYFLYHPSSIVSPMYHCLFHLLFIYVDGNFFRYLRMDLIIWSQSQSGLVTPQLDSPLQQLQFSLVYSKKVKPSPWSCTQLGVKTFWILVSFVKVTWSLNLGLYGWPLLQINKLWNQSYCL